MMPSTAHADPSAAGGLAVDADTNDATELSPGALGSEGTDFDPPAEYRRKGCGRISGITKLAALGLSIAG